MSLFPFDRNMREMISTFENRWNQRLQSMAQVKPVQNDQVTAICRELSRLCQVFQQQAAHIQTPLSNVQNRLRTLESQNATNSQRQGASVPIGSQNGH